MPTGKSICSVVTFTLIPISENASTNACTKKLKYLKKKRIPILIRIVPINMNFRFLMLLVLPMHSPDKKVVNAVINSSPRNRQSHQP